MTRANKLKARGRFHELVVAEALGKATECDRAKLERYQALLRYRPSEKERRARSRFEYQGAVMLKIARALGEHGKPPPQKAIDLINSRFWELV